MGDALKGPGNGLDSLPIPVSTPGFDSAPTLTATNVITKDPETGVQNQGTYRAGLKAPERMVVRMATRTGGAGGYQHWKAYKARGEKMPCAVVLGCPPFVAFMGPQKLPLGMDEMEVAGGLAGEPIALVKGRTVDLLVRLNVGGRQQSMQVIEIVEPRVKEESEIVHVPLFRAEAGDDNQTRFVSTGEEPTFIRELAEQGVAVPREMFEGDEE